MKRIVTIQDVSCVGKCSLTVALPIISAMGIETAIIPTAVLSTHTMFSGFTFKDLTDQIQPISDHWKRKALNLTQFIQVIWALLSKLSSCVISLTDIK